MRIGNSPLAPIFEVLERPNGWDRQVQDMVQYGELSERGNFRRDFWAHVSKPHPGEAPLGRASSNVYHRVEEVGRRVSQYVARDGVGVFFPRERGESYEERSAAVELSVKWLQEETKDAEIPENGWSFLKIDPYDQNNWDRMSDLLHDRRLLYERALREPSSAT